MQLLRQLESTEITNSIGQPEILQSSASTETQLHQGNCAVFIQNLCKSYGKKSPVIQNLSMKVKAGTIYGLIGSSGCGKSTLLSCVVGLQKWDLGKILVLGRLPRLIDNSIGNRSVGFMPQELALHHCLTISELFYFYGRIYNMKGSMIQTQYFKLQDLFELPTGKNTISDLSGGQKRRVSLALAMLHSPELLVLDEPTVGMDPLLREKVWKHFSDIVKANGSTILVTTHYIDEARSSDTIGLLRNGRLLIESSPALLQTTFQSDCFQDIVLKLCKMNTTESLQVEHLECPSTKLEPTFQPGRLSVHNETQSEKRRRILNKKISGFSKTSERVYGQTLVLLLLIVRYKPFVTILLLLPALQGSIVMFTISYPPIGLNVGIVNHDQNNSKGGCPSRVFGMDVCNLTSLSCMYINSLADNGNVVPNFYNTEKDALENTRLGQIWGYIVFPENYSQSMVDVFAMKHFASNESLEKSRVSVYMDKSNFLVTYYWSKYIHRSFFNFVELVSKLCQLPREELKIPLRFRIPVFGSSSDENSQFIMPGFIICSSLCLMCGLSGVMFIGDYNQKNVTRTHVAGLKFFEIQLSYFIALTIITFIQTVIWYIVLHLGFGFVVVGSSVLCLLVCILVGLCGTAMGLLLAVIFNSEVDVGFVCVYLNINLMLFGGVFFPKENMSILWQKIGYLLPTTLPARSLISVVVRGYGIFHPLVWPGLVVIIIWTFIISLCNCAVYKKCCPNK